MNMTNIKDICVRLGANIISTDRNYWLVRTKGGKFFDEFYFQSYISIGWNNIDILSTDPRDEKQLIIDMKEDIKEFYEDEKVPGRAARQIYRFVKEMKAGDIVIVPNADSKFIAFGEIESNHIYKENIENENIDIEYLEKAILYNGDEDFIDESLAEIGCPFEKRRRVKWLKRVNRNELDSNLYSLLNSHGTISSASKYSYSIDRELSSFYIKGDNAHLVYRVTTIEDVAAIDLTDFVYNNLNLVDIYNKLFDENISKKDIKMKLNVQSPGPIDLQGNIAGIGAIAILGVFLIGGKFKYKKDSEGNVEAEVGSNGFMGQIIEMINTKNMSRDFRTIQDNLNSSMNKLQIKSPELSPLSDDLSITKDENN